MKKAFITGISGFAGSYLAEHLIELGNYEVSGTYLTDSSLENVEGIKEKIELHQVDLQDSQATKSIIAKAKPDLIYHLAALSSVGDSFSNPSEFISNNISVQVNIFEAVRSAEINSRVLVISSSEVYGEVLPQDLPIDEETPLRPVNPYAVSKIAQDFLGLQYYLSYKIPVVRVRPFNHIGARQSPAFVVSSFAKKIVDIEKGVTEPVLKVGNLEAKRDFTDVHDMMKAYVQILEKGKVGDVYNIGRGDSFKIKDIVNKLLSFSTKEIKVEVDQALLRPMDVPDVVCDNTKIKQATGWEAQIPLDQTLKSTLEYWRSQN